jgi:dTDP-4-amino-4,6-dideoxygalactose transaminase
MTERIPFLRPSLVPSQSYLGLLQRIDSTHLYSNYGPLCTEFESRVIAEAYDGVGSLCTVNNATIGLVLAIQQARRPGRYAVMPSFTFAATPLAAQWAGLDPYFVDVDPETWCLDPIKLQEALDHLGEEIAVVVPYATFGTGLDLKFYAELHRSSVPVVVDAAASFGTQVDGEWYGKGFPGFVVFSFHATKAFGIGEGGAVYSADTVALQRLRRAGNFGFGADRVSCDQGLNSKISEYTAAIALATWEAYPEKVRRRRAIHDSYESELAALNLGEVGWRTQKVRGAVPFQFMSLLSPEGVLNRQVVDRLSDLGVECRTYFSPACHQQPQFSGCPHAVLDVTESLSGRILSLPLWEEMTTAHVERILRGITG